MRFISRFQSVIQDEITKKSGSGISSGYISNLVKVLIALSSLLIATLCYGFSNKTITSNEILLNLAIAIFVLIAFQVIYDLFVKIFDTFMLKSIIQEVVRENLRSELLLEPKDAGITTLDSLSNLKLSVSLNRGIKHSYIDFLFIGFNESFISDDAKQSLINLLKNTSFKARFLLLDPTHPIVKARQLYDRNDNYLSEIYLNFNKFKEFESGLEASGISIDDKITTKYTQEYPFGLYIRADRLAWFTPIWNSASARRQAFIEVNLEINEKLGKSLHDNFEYLWKNSKPRKEIANPEIMDQSVEDYLRYVHSI